MDLGESPRRLLKGGSAAIERSISGACCLRNGPYSDTSIARPRNGRKSVTRCQDLLRILGSRGGSTALLSARFNQVSL